MLETIICIAAIFAISFAVKEIDGPFNIITTTRSWLLRNSYVGTFFYGLLQCYFCIGWHAGVIVYFLHQHFEYLNFWDMILWGFGGSTISLGINLWMEKKL